jgi:hypothetical protein
LLASTYSFQPPILDSINHHPIAQPLRPAIRYADILQASILRINSYPGSSLYLPRLYLDIHPAHRLAPPSSTRFALHPGSRSASQGTTHLTIPTSEHVQCRPPLPSALAQLFAYSRILLPQYQALTLPRASNCTVDGRHQIESLYPPPLRERAAFNPAFRTQKHPVEAAAVISTRHRPYLRRPSSRLYSHHTGTASLVPIPTSCLANSVQISVSSRKLAACTASRRVEHRFGTAALDCLALGSLY